MPLEQEINDQRKLIRADGYQMSIGEISNMYRDGDLDIHPAFQRFFRWEQVQKSNWIESLLLGIPTPSIFVAQRKDGVWDVVDGLQRLSTIFEFMGILKDPKGDTLPPLELSGTQYLPSLEGATWSTGPNAMPEELQRFLKREKLDVKIVKRESDESTKYELFQRLNTGGSSLSNQELRNCIIVSVDPEFFEWLFKLSQEPAFVDSVSLPDRMMQEQFDIELVLRFILFRNIELEELSSIKSISDFITKKLINLLNDPDFDQDRESEIFKSAIGLANDALGEDAFRKYSLDKEKFTGPFLQSAFEIIAMGLGYEDNEPSRGKSPAEISDIILGELWSDPTKVVSRTGESAVARLPRTLRIGREIFE